MATILIVCSTLMVVAPNAYADHVTPVPVDGNPSCADLIDDPDVKEFKINDPGTGTYSDVSSGFSVTITVHTTTLGPTFDFSGASIPVDAVFVKGGPSGNLYSYDPAVTADTGLHAQVNPNNDRYYGLSHISFCWVPRPSTVLTLDSTDPATFVAHPGDTVSVTVTETNDGNQTLTSVHVTANHGGTCVGGPTTLAPTETATFECTFDVPTNQEDDLVFAIVGHGTAPDGKDVTWCEDPGSPPTGVRCDQDERVTVTLRVINPETTLGLQSSSPDPLKVHVGDEVTLTFRETNTGDSTLTGVHVTTDYTDCVPQPNNETLAPGAFVDVSCTFTVPDQAIDTIDITAIGHGIDELGFDVTWCEDPSDPPAATICSQEEIEEVTITVLRPSTTLSLQSPTSPVLVAPGDDVVITFREVNNGNTGLTNVHVTTDHPDCILTPASVDLAPTEEQDFTCTITVPNNQVDDIEIVAIGHGTDELGFDVTWCEDPANPPAMTICDQDERATITIQVANPGTTLSLDSASPSSLIVHAGEEVTLTFREKNVGNTQLTKVQVTTDYPDCSPTPTNVTLDPGEEATFACTFTVPGGQQDDIEIAAIGHGEDPLGRNVTWCEDPANPPADTVCDQREREDVTLNVISPSTDLDLLSSTPDPLVVKPGDTVTLTFRELNDGDSNLINVFVSTDYADCSPTPTGTTLAPTKHVDVSCTFVVPDMAPGELVITAIGHGEDLAGFDVTWCSDPANPPAQTVCDQDERVQVRITVEGFEGCTPGYWKQPQHFDSWTATGYSPTDSFEAIFGRNVPGTPTLLDALNLNGGGLRALMRHAAASLLNSAHAGVDFPYSSSEVIAMFQAAFDSGDYNTTKNQFAAANEAGCPLS